MNGRCNYPTFISDTMLTLTYEKIDNILTEEQNSNMDELLLFRNLDEWYTVASMINRSYQV